jgi:hypothetical protein
VETLPEPIQLTQGSIPIETRIVNIASPVKERHPGAIIILLIFLTTLATISFSVGWFGSLLKERFAAAPAEIRSIKSATASAKNPAWALYKDKDNTYSIFYPKEWKLSAHSTNDSPGVKVSDEASSVELWLRFDKAVELSSEQKQGLKSTKTESLEINGQAALITTYEYKAGNFFNVIIFPATENRPQATFWLLAADSEAKDTATQIVNSFKFE